MIVVTVQLHSAVTRKVTTLGQAIIHNVAVRDGGARGDYEVCVGRKPDAIAGDLRAIIKNPLRKGKVLNHARLSQSVWRLVLKGLVAAFPEEAAARRTPSAVDRNGKD